MKRIEKAVYPQLLIGVLGLIGMTLVIMSVFNPLVEYRGEAMRKSLMLAEQPGEIFCQQMSSFSLAVMYTCFDSAVELSAFAESR
jgi:hypothetical protein